MLPLDDWAALRHLHDYLLAKAPAGRLPGRQHVAPVEIHELLPKIMLLDVLPRPGAAPRYRIRLMGSAVVAIQGRDATGDYVDKVLDNGADVIDAYGRILETRRPQYRHGRVATFGREHILYERVAFPLARDGETVDMLLFLFADGVHANQRRLAS